jgi:hypothetical protein
VRHLPLDRESERAKRKREQAKLMTDAQGQRRREERVLLGATIKSQAASSVPGLSDVEILRLGAVSYWCEGTKVKPWRPGTERVVFTNSDEGLILLFLRFLQVLDVAADRVDFRVAIHETADVEAAVNWWAGVVGVPGDRFLRTTLKRHVAKKVGRRNVGDGYHGCLVVTVRRSRDLYWMIEGLVTGIVAATRRADGAQAFAPDLGVS